MMSLFSTADKLSCAILITLLSFSCCSFSCCSCSYSCVHHRQKVTYHFLLSSVLNRPSSLFKSTSLVFKSMSLVFKLIFCNISQNIALGNTSLEKKCSTAQAGVISWGVNIAQRPFLGLRNLMLCP